VQGELPGGNRRWIPAAIIAAGIVIAGALIGAAVMLSNRDKGAGPAASSAAATEASSTCQAWKTTRTAINAVPRAPRWLGLGHPEYRHLHQ
jgi:hypothetical protein